MNEKLWLAAAGLCFLAVFARTMLAIGAHRFEPSRSTVLLNACGFVFLTAFLHFRGQLLGRCPLTNLAEVLIFLAWSTVLIYLVVGTPYRLSLIGVFTAPLVLVLLGLALVMHPTEPPTYRSAPLNPWLETHAAVSLIAYGAFALACLSGLMYLLQDRQLKRRVLTEWFYQLPPIQTLGQATYRLILFGFLLLTFGLVAGFLVNRSTTEIKLILSFGVWLLYGAILTTRFTRSLSARTLATLAVGAFLLSVGSLWGMEFLQP